jgi:hypothetical protein
MHRKFYVENMDRKLHLEDIVVEGRLKFYARLHGVTSRKKLSSAISKITSHYLSDVIRTYLLHGAESFLRS